jgi:hypothetical protein
MYKGVLIDGGGGDTDLLPHPEMTDGARQA